MTSAAPATPFLPVSERIAAVILALCQTVTMRVRGATATATVTQAQLTYIGGRLRGMRRRFNQLVERIRAGKPPRPRARKPRAKKPPPDPEFPLGFRPPPKGWSRWAVRPDKPVPLWRSLGQQRCGWLLPFAPNEFGFRESAALHRGQLLALLAEPETRALLLMSRRVGDTLRPLCWMLGIEFSLLYPARPPTSSAVVSTSDSMAPAPVRADRAPKGEEIPIFATPGPNVPGVIEPPGAGPRARYSGGFFAPG